jgi:hypothetical protein
MHVRPSVALRLGGSAARGSAALRLGVGGYLARPVDPTVPCARKFWLSWKLLAGIAAIFDHEGQMFHANFRMMELVREDGCLRG